MNPKSNERCVFVGPTGSGKTVLARTMLRGRENVLIVDPKGQWETSPGDLVAKNLKDLEAKLNFARKDGRRVVYKVPREHLLPYNAAYLDDVARMVLERKHTLLYYDELVFVASATDFARRAPNFYFAMTTGRSSGVGVWGSVQRPSHVPSIVFSETEYRATFYLRKESDRDRMEETMGDDIPWDVLRANRYAFVFADDLDITKPLTLKLLPASHKRAA